MHLKPVFAALLIASAHISLCTGSFLNVSLSLVAHAAGAPAAEEALMTPAPDVMLCTAMTPATDTEPTETEPEGNRCSDPEGCLRSAPPVLGRSMEEIVFSSSSLVGPIYFATLQDGFWQSATDPSLVAIREGPLHTWSVHRAKMIAKRE